MLCLWVCRCHFFGHAIITFLFLLCFLLQNRVHHLLPFAIMGINALLAGILCMTLPETNNQPMLETVKRDEGYEISRLDAEDV